MTKRHQYTILTRTVAGLLAAVCLVSCLKTERIFSSFSADRSPIEFYVSAERTKTVVSAGCLSNSYTIYASAYFRNLTDPSNSGNYFVSRPLRNDGGVWKSDPAVYWPLGGKLDFLAVACEDGAFDIGGAVWHKDDCSAGVEIPVADGSCLDSEIMFAAAVDRTSENGEVSLRFKHTQSWLQFVISTDADIIRIDDITLEDVYTGGALRISNGITPDAEWSFLEHSRMDCVVPGSQGLKPRVGEPSVCNVLVPEQDACSIVVHYSVKSSVSADWSTAVSQEYRYAAEKYPWYYGEKNIFYIKYDFTEITFKVSVDEWGEESTVFI